MKNSRLYIVEQIANRENSLCDGYAQGIEVFFEDRFCGGWYDSGWDEKFVVIQQKEVLANCPIEAIYKFKEYLNGGLGMQPRKPEDISNETILTI